MATLQSWRVAITLQKICKRLKGQMKNMFKKILALFLAATVISSTFASCGNNGDNGDTDSINDIGNTVDTSDNSDDTQDTDNNGDTSDINDTGDTVDTSDSGDDTQDTDNNGDTTDDTTDDTGNTDDATNTPDVVVTIEDLQTAILDAYGDLYDANNEMGMPMSGYSANFTENAFDLNFPGLADPENDLGMPISEYITTEFENIYGVRVAWIDELVANKAASITNVDTLIIVKPTEGNEENVFNALTAYHDFLAADAFQYPINLPKIRNAKVFTEGGYVFFVMLGTLPDELVYVEIDYENLSEEEIAAEQAKIDAAQDKYCAGNTQKAVDAVNELFGK